MAKPPMAIPTMGPVPRELECDEVPDCKTAVVVGEEEDMDDEEDGDEVAAPVAVVVREGLASTGKYSRGLNSRLVAWVYKN